MNDSADWAEERQMTVDLTDWKVNSTCTSGFHRHIGAVFGAEVGVFQTQGLTETAFVECRMGNIHLGTWTE